MPTTKQKYAEAIEAWNELFRHYPGERQAARRARKKGMALERLGRRSQALIEYRYVVERYPNSDAGRKAREKLNPVVAASRLRRTARRPAKTSMASVNKVILIGNLGGTRRSATPRRGEPIANFSLATTERWTDKDGQKQERTEWHRVEVFGKTAQVVRDYCTKGKQVYLEGSIHYDEWTDKDGNKRNTTKIRVSGPNSRSCCSAAAATAEAAAGAAARRSADRRRGAAAARRLPGLRRRRAVLAGC